MARKPTASTPRPVRPPASRSCLRPPARLRQERPRSAVGAASVPARASRSARSRIPSIWRRIMTNTPKPMNGPAMRDPGVASPNQARKRSMSARAAGAIRFHHERPRCRELRRHGCLEQLSGGREPGRDLLERLRPALREDFLVDAEHERAPGFDRADDEAAVGVRRHEVADGEPLELRDDRVRAPASHVHDIVAVPAAAPVAHLDEPRPDRLGRGVDRDPSGVHRRRRVDQAVTRQDARRLDRVDAPSRLPRRDPIERVPAARRDRRTDDHPSEHDVTSSDRSCACAAARMRAIRPASTDGWSHAEPSEPSAQRRGVAEAFGSASSSRMTASDSA